MPWKINNRGWLGSKWLWVGLLLTVWSCNHNNTAPDALVELYVDLRIASAEYTDTIQARKARQNILRQAGLSTQEFRTSMESVRSNPEQWVAFQDAVLARLDSLRKQSRSNQPTQVIDSNRVRNDARKHSLGILKRLQERTTP